MNENITALIPCPIDIGIWVEDTKTLAALNVGSVGIFMPIKYSEESVYIANNATLYLQDLADYGFYDGERYAFVQRTDDVKFAYWAYESLDKKSSMEEIKKFIIEKLDK